MIELRNGMLQVLRAYPPLVETKVAIYDKIERGVAHSYIEMGRQTDNDDGSDSADGDYVDGAQTSISVICRARRAQFPLADRLAEMARRALHNNENIPVAGRRLVSCLHQFTEHLTEQDDTVDVTVVVFEVLTETI